MLCQEPECQKKAKFICSVHLTKFCGSHYGKHSSICENKAITIESVEKIKSGQIKTLNRKVARAKGLIIEHANSLILAIGETVKTSLMNIDQQKLMLMEMIQMYKPENQIKEILEIVAKVILVRQNSIQSLIDIEGNVNFENFKEEVNKIVKKFNVKKNSVLKVPEVSPVLERLEKLDINGKIEWCNDKKLLMINKDFVHEIKISKDANFIITCIKY